MKRFVDKIGLDVRTVDRMRNQNGEILSPLVERFLVLENWRADITPPEYAEFSYYPDAEYVAQLVRDLAVEIIKIKEKLGMIKEE